MPIKLDNEYNINHAEFEKNSRKSIFKDVLNLSDAWESEEILDSLKKIMPREPNSISAYGLTDELINRYTTIIDKENQEKHEKEIAEIQEGLDGAKISDDEFKEIVREELFSKSLSGKKIKELTQLIDKNSEAGDLIIEQIKKYFSQFDLDSRVEIIENLRDCKLYLDTLINYAIANMQEEQIIELIPAIKSDNDLVIDIVNKLLYNQGVDDYSDQIIEKLTPILLEINNDEALKAISNKLISARNDEQLLKFNKLLIELPIFFNTDPETIYLRPWLLKLKLQIKTIKERKTINSETRTEVLKNLE